MRTDYAEIMLERLSRSSELSGIEFLRTDEFRELGYPVKKPIAVIGKESENDLGCLLGCDDGLFGSEKLNVTVMTDETHGGAFCADLARKICGVILNCDEERLIVSVCVEKCMYDKTAFAYKVIMRFTLREHGQHV